MLHRASVVAQTRIRCPSYELFGQLFILV
jgi:hypothetical protein